MSLFRPPKFAEPEEEEPKPKPKPQRPRGATRDSVADRLRVYRNDLIDAIDTFLKAYKNWNYDKIKRQKKRMEEILKWLEDLT